MNFISPFNELIIALTALTHHSLDLFICLSLPAFLRWQFFRKWNPSHSVFQPPSSSITPLLWSLQPFTLWWWLFSNLSELKFSQIFSFHSVLHEILSSKIWVCLFVLYVCVWLCTIAFFLSTTAHTTGVNDCFLKLSLYFPPYMISLHSRIETLIPCCEISDYIIVVYYMID